MTGKKNSKSGLHRDFDGSESRSGTGGHRPTASSGHRKKAVALSYNPDKDVAPRVVATGQGLTAETICRIAQENQVPLYKNEGVAEHLVRQELNTPIPVELYTAVAEILAFVYQLDKQSW